VRFWNKLETALRKLRRRACPCQSALANRQD
jgi:hypothetical protein